MCVTLAKKYETWIADRAAVALAWPTIIERFLMQLSLQRRVARPTFRGICPFLKLEL